MRRVQRLRRRHRRRFPPSPRRPPTAAGRPRVRHRFQTRPARMEVARLRRRKSRPGIRHFLPTDGRIIRRHPARSGDADGHNRPTSAGHKLPRPRVGGQRAGPKSAQRRTCCDDGRRSAGRAACSAGRLFRHQQRIHFVLVATCPAPAERTDPQLLGDDRFFRPDAQPDHRLRFSRPDGLRGDRTELRSKSIGSTTTTASASSRKTCWPMDRCLLPV